MTCVERVKDYAEYKDIEVENPDWDQKLTKTKNHKKDQYEQKKQNWPTQGEIKISNLKIRYRDDLPLVLKGINLEIKPGEKVGVVGRTGSGKSTLMLCLLRIVQNTDNDNGFISIDGERLDQLRLEEVRRGVEIIPQNPFLFKGTLKTNLDPYSQHSDEDILEVLNRIQFFDTLELPGNKNSASDLERPKKSTNEPDKQKIGQNLPTGIDQKNSEYGHNLDFVVEKGGSNLSLGQRQLICIARALVKNSKVVLMDESTASIDEKTDSIVQKIIAEHLKDTTILTIAHRINTVINYDRIVVMDDGLIVENGSPEQLSQIPGGIFAGFLKESNLN